MKKLYTLAFSLLFSASCAYAQQPTLTKEDSLNNGQINKSSTIVSGYGEALYQHNTNEKTANINLARAVIFLGHKFNDKISFFSETEVEDAKVAGGEEGGEIALEQAHLKFNLKP